MTRISLEDATSRLTELIAGLQPGEEVQIVQGDRPVARVVAEDDEHLENFKHHMP